MRCSPEAATFDDALYVAQNMRQRDADEIYALRWSDNPARVAEDSFRPFGFTWCFLYDGRPAVILGAYPGWPRVWNVFMYATDDFRQIRFSVTRFIRNAMIPCLMALGAHRAQAMSKADYAEAHEWLEFLGAEKEAEHSCFGRDGQAFVTFVWGRHGSERGKRRRSERS